MLDSDDENEEEEAKFDTPTSSEKDATNAKSTGEIDQRSTASLPNTSNEPISTESSSLPPASFSSPTQSSSLFPPSLSQSDQELDNSQSNANDAMSLHFPTPSQPSLSSMPIQEEHTETPTDCAQPLPANVDIITTPTGESTETMTTGVEKNDAFAESAAPPSDPEPSVESGAVQSSTNAPSTTATATVTQEDEGEDEMLVDMDDFLNAS